MAVNAAMTGHLVLSTLHTNSAFLAVQRLVEMGVQPYLATSVTNVIIGQRLVRLICPDCRARVESPRRLLEQYAPMLPIATTFAKLRKLQLLPSTAEGPASMKFFRGRGCTHCNHSGYRGRIGIYEVMRVTDKLRRQIASRTPEDQIREVALSGGMISLGEDGLAKVKSGVTTPEELLRVVTEVRELRTLCAGCGATVGVDFLACPHCGKRLSDGCTHCGRALEPGWSFCPYCARSAEKKRVPKRLRDRDEHERRELPAASIAEFRK